MFMHSHPTEGWQGMSHADVVAERDRIAPPANSTKMPLVGLTAGTDGSWSARFWIKQSGGEYQRFWCDKVKVIGDHFKVTFNEQMYDPFQSKKYFTKNYRNLGNA